MFDNDHLSEIIDAINRDWEREIGPLLESIKRDQDSFFEKFLEGVKVGRKFSESKAENEKI